MNFRLTDLISAGEVVTSSELNRRCIDRGLDAVYARQLVRRASNRDGIWRSEILALSNNSRIFAHRDFLGTAPFIEKLIKILATERPGLARLLKKLNQQAVVISPHARMLLACPVEKSKARYPMFNSEIAALEEAQCAWLEANDTIKERVVSKSAKGTTNASLLSLRSVGALAIERALANILMTHLEQQNFLSWRSEVTRVNDSQLEIFNNYSFVGVSFSYIDPLRRWDATRARWVPTPVLLHVCSGPAGIEDVEGLVARLQRAGVNPNSELKVVGLIAARDFESDAFKAAKQQGFIVINLNEFFGEKAFEAIAAVQDLLKNVAGDPDKADQKEYETLRRTLEDLKTNPFIVDLKGMAFEAVVGFLIRNEGWEEVQLNLKVPWETVSREVDVSGQKVAWDEVHIVECKAESAEKELDTAYVRKFFTETVPAFIQAKCLKGNPSHCFAEIWTTGKVGKSAWTELQNLKLKKFLRPKLLDRSDILARVPKTLAGTKRLIETIASG